MAYNPGITDTSIISQGARESKLDIATPVNIYTSLRADRRAQKLSELTLSKEERAQKRSEEYQGILKSSITPKGFIDSERAIVGLNKAGFVDEALAIQDRYQKAAEAKRQASEKQSQDMSTAFLTAVDSKNPVEAFLLAREEGGKNGWKLSPGLLGYNPSDEEIASGEFKNPKVKQELIYHGERYLTPEQRIARAKGISQDKTLSAKDQLEEDRRKAGEALSEEFRTLMLPQLKVGNLTTDKNARNELVKTINASKYWNTPLAKQVLEQLKGQSSSLIDDMAAVLSKSNVAETKLTGDEEKGLGAVSPAVADMNKLIDMYQAGDTGSLASSAADKASRLPVIGQRLFKGPAEFGKHKDIMAERFLRAATGAAAPKEEVATYRGFLPEWGDTPEQAQTAVDAFMGNVKAKADQSVSRLRILGTKESIAKAEEIEANINNMIKAVKPIKIEPVSVGKWKKVN